MSVLMRIGRPVVTENEACMVAFDTETKMDDRSVTLAIYGMTK